MTDLRPLRCAIYTRKSSEEGLDQAFNSLEAQREACAAYIESQRHEGWQALTTAYDDGGFSGGTLNRPALHHLLADIDAGHVDLIVVYKIDRLTRSLADFAKIVERLDARSASFVSVTQSFNTTTSMGRLTLNVLLSFAQFEREVTGERIRDKIAASKKKGMWMGGFAPLGYDAVDRKLVINSVEADVVRLIFSSYLDQKNIAAVRRCLAAKGITSKWRAHAKGRGRGGVTYSCGALLKILANPLYAGRVAHRDKAYPGQHEAIVTADVWNTAQAVRKERGRSGVVPRARKNYPLLGLVVDASGGSMSAVHTTKGSRRYRYYVSRQQAGQPTPTGQRLRIPARDLEGLVASRLMEFFQSKAEVTDHVGNPSDSTQQRSLLIEAAQAVRPHDWLTYLQVLRRVEIRAEEVALTIDGGYLRQLLRPEPSAPPSSSAGTGEAAFNLTFPCRLIRTGHEIRLVIPGKTDVDAMGRRDENLLRVLALGRRWYAALIRGKAESLDANARREALPQSYVARVLFGSLLAPDIIQDVLDGRHPVELTTEFLRKPMPLDWKAQRNMLAS